MYKIIKSYEIPFLEQVTMPAHWAIWLSGRGKTNPKLREAAESVDKNAPLTWDYRQHGPAPWMQFFYDWRFADLTGDGKIEMLLTCGAKRQRAYQQDGTLLWEYHDPNAGFMDIRLDTNFPVADIDQDGMPELVCARMVKGQLNLCIVNARNGKLLRSIPFPGMEFQPRDCRGSIIIANVSGKNSPADIIVSWDYAWISAYNADLNLMWERTIPHEAGRHHVTMGHTPFPADIDGDGRDEILAGSCLLNHDGSTRWVVEDHDALVKDGHADSIMITRLDDLDDPVVLMSTGGYCFSAEGKLQWGRDELKHGQALRVGKIRADVPGRQVVVYEAASRVVEGTLDKVIALDKNGNMLWDFSIHQPDMQEGGFGFWIGDWTGDGYDEVFINDPEKVNILNGYGEIIETIPGHLIYVFDLAGDQRVEAVLLDQIAPGMQLQIVTNTDANRHPITNQITAHRITTKAMYNCTRY